jgi:hypothetical protein
MPFTLLVGLSACDGEPTFCDRWKASTQWSAVDRLSYEALAVTGTVVIADGPRQTCRDDRSSSRMNFDRGSIDHVELALGGVDGSAVLRLRAPEEEGTFALDLLLRTSRGERRALALQFTDRRDLAGRVPRRKHRSGVLRRQKRLRVGASRAARGHAHGTGFARRSPRRSSRTPDVTARTRAHAPCASKVPRARTASGPRSAPAPRRVAERRAGQSPR